MADPPLLPTTRRPSRISALRDYGIVFSFVALFAALALSTDAFLTTRNLLNILDQQAAIGIIACTGTLVLIAGGLDLSTGAVFAFSGIVAAETVDTLGVWGAMGLAVAVALVLGMLNGLLATVGRINAIIATLATGIMIRGLAIAATGGLLVRVTEPSYATLGRGGLLGIKYSVWMFVGVILITGFLLRATTFGRYIFAAGGNQEAARLAGVRIDLVRSATFAISGLGAGLAGILSSSRVATGQADAGAGLEISAIAAIVIGGTSILGGEGAIWRTVLGLLLLALVRNGFNLLNINPIFQQIFQGAIILAAVAVDAWARRDTA
ncbi:MAG TPA: ABC transporter permease [Acidimicrobiia bacterium]|nr:ABC transporter permease [Acidimicrobiia bacterium]